MKQLLSARDTMHDFDVIAAVNCVRAPSVVLASTDGEVKHCLPSRPRPGTTLAMLEAMGVYMVDIRSEDHAIFVIPPGWSIYRSGLNIHQQRLYDQDGRPRARLFYRPGSPGGEIEVLALDCEEPTLQQLLSPPRY